MPGPFTTTATVSDRGDRVAGEATGLCGFPSSPGPSSLPDALAAMDLSAGASSGESPRSAVAAGSPHILFRVGEAIFAAALTELLEVIRPPAVSPVPDAPDWLVGLANVRGDVTSIIDFRAVLDLEPTASRSGMVLVARTADGATVAGLVVDQVLGIRRMVVNPWANDGEFDWGRVGEFLCGLGDDGDRLVPVVGLGRVLGSARLCAFATA